MRFDFPLRPFLQLRLCLSCMALSCLAWLGPAQADPAPAEHVRAELIAENQALSIGGDNWLALRIVPDEGWHVYWRNPGDSGLPTTLAWTLPAAVTVGPMEWPYPRRETTGDIVNYGYHADTLLPVPLHVPPDWPAPSPVSVQAKARWLVCRDICIPGSAELSLRLAPPAPGQPVQADPRWRDTFAAARAELPQPAPADWSVQFAARDGDFSLAVGGAHLSTGGVIEFFPYAGDLVRHSAPQRIDNENHLLRISQSLNDSFIKAPPQVDGVLVLHDGASAKAWEIHARPGPVKPVPAGAVPAAGIAAAAAAPASLARTLLFALLGGIILNLMPCVFPVLSIKAISLIEARGRVARHQRGHAVAYTFGVLLMFGALAAALIGLRRAGAAVGWGFQLQQPAFVAGLVYLFFIMGLSLSGLVQFGTRIMGMGQALAAQGGYRGSFFTGLLAVVVASPCITPFVGTALGYALAQPPPVAGAVFLCLGLGLALPFLLIGFFPRLGAFLPRPGAWMETFKQAMAFPLYLTVVFLLWVLGGQAGRDAIALALVGLVLLSLAVWLRAGGRLGAVLRYAAVAAALALLATPQLRAPPADAAPAARAGGAHEPWSPQRLAELREQGRTVFVNFTADWCVTCKVNEHLALTSARVEQAFAERNVAWLEGDWSRGDPAITEVLDRFGSPGVPLYLVYVNGGEPRVLPQNLTPSIVVDALGPAAPPAGADVRAAAQQ
ncbi:MAG: thioredoxin family protein [Nevskia sp.]|nr:thioredoxin family protein [Nevskia sp.]